MKSEALNPSEGAQTMLNVVFQILYFSLMSQLGGDCVGGLHAMCERNGNLYRLWSIAIPVYPKG